MKNKEKNFVSAVVYVHNAENTIKEFLNAVIGVLENNFEHSEIICVNDGSTDNSRKIIEAVSSQTTSASLSVINMSYFHGLELAMNAGTDLSIGDFVFEFDNTVLDFTQADVMGIYLRELEGFDIVSASADKPSRPSSKIFYGIYNKYSKNRSKKIKTESFRILSRRVINRVSQMNKSLPYRKVVYSFSGLKSDNIIYTTTGDERVKRSKDEKGFRMELAIDALIMFTDFGYKISTIMTFLMLAVITVVAIYTLAAYIFRNPVEGWTSTILFLSISFFGVFMILTVIIKYLQILMGLVFKRQQYSVESVEKLTK